MPSEMVSPEQLAKIKGKLDILVYLTDSLPAMVNYKEALNDVRPVNLRNNDDAIESARLDFIIKGI